MVYAVLIVLVLMALCLLALFRLREESGRESVRRRKIRDSDLYEGLYPLLKEAGRHTIASVLVTSGEVSVRFLDPAVPPVRYQFAQQGLQALDEAYVLALAQAVAGDIPCLADEGQYALVEKRIRGQDGTERISYSYEIRMDQKARMLRERAGRRMGG